MSGSTYSCLAVWTMSIRASTPTHHVSQLLIAMIALSWLSQSLASHPLLPSFWAPRHD